MARKIIIKEDGLAGSGNAPSGYKFLGDSLGDISEKVGATVSAIGGGGEALPQQTAVVELSSAELIAGKDLFTIPVGKRLTELSILIINRAGSVAWVTAGANPYILIRSQNNGDVLININKEFFSWWGADNETYINYVWGQNGGTTSNTLGVFQEPIPNLIEYRVAAGEMATGNGTATFKIRYRLEDAL